MAAFVAYPGTYQIITFGCQMNEHDSEMMAGVLENIGFTPAEHLEQSDVIFLNTCCVRETAEHKVFSLLGRLRRLKKEKPGLIIGVSGCMTQQDGMAARIRRGFPYVDLILGTGAFKQLPDLMERVLAGRGPAVAVLSDLDGEVESLPLKRKPGLRAWVAIMYGCNNFCTYCIVPYVRGRERSRAPEEVLADVTQLGQEGYREVFLLGQNVNSYGKDLGPGLDFAYLLEKLEQGGGDGGVSRIRYMTSHPRDFSDRLIERIAASDKVCEHFHLPVQAGSNRILKMMNRGYSREDYLGLLEKIRNRLPYATITTDIMVGFPGEEERDFEDTLDLVRRARFDSAYTFIYNTRPGTPAASLAGQIPETVKKARIGELIALQNSISLQRNQAEEGREQEVLVEEESKTESGLLVGKSRGNKPVHFPGGQELIGRTVRVLITEARLARLIGRPLL